MILIQICRALTILCCCASVAILVYFAIAPGMSAIQQTTGFVLAVAIVVIPYVFTRSIEGFPFPD